jgi:transposase InsO family protein
MRPRPVVTDPVVQSERAYESRISERDREQIREQILSGWARQESVSNAWASAWDEGIMLGSLRTWWRIAAQIEDQLLRPRVPTKKQVRGGRAKPVLKATGPGQVWSWDITDLPSPWRGIAFKGYKVTDIYSREIVAWRVESREADHLAVAMFQEAIREHGAPLVVHADSGPAMISNALKEYLESEGVILSHSRAYVSNDNPFSEAGFRTMKYRPGYPRVFDTVEDARAYVADYVPWYNHQHKHSGIAWFSPAQVGDGTWEQVWEVRDKALQDYYQAHPGRFRGRPRTPTPADTVGINLPNEKTTKINTK